MAKCPEAVESLIQYLKESGTGKSKLIALHSLGERVSTPEEFLSQAPKVVPEGTMEKVLDFVNSRLQPKPQLVHNLPAYRPPVEDRRAEETKTLPLPSLEEIETPKIIESQETPKVVEVKELLSLEESNTEVIDPPLLTNQSPINKPEPRPNTHKHKR